jgi:hypothetical protein
MMTNEDLVKVHIDLSGNPDTGGEAMWAKPLGDDLYELRNSPFYAYTLNFLDVVRAVPQDSDSKPSIQSVERPSGHRTLWITFSDSVPDDECLRLASELDQWHASFERAHNRYFAVDVEPDGQLDAVMGRLEQWRKEGILCRYRSGPADSDVRDA